MKIVEPTAPPVTSIYPDLPTEADGSDGHSYRIREISRLKKRLEDERDQRYALYKKYRRGVNILDGVDAALITTCMGLGIGGVGLLTTIIAAPVVLGLEIAALACGTLGMVGKFVSRRLAVKATKHDRIKVLAEAKLNTIVDLVSTALLDGNISDQEFRLIMNEVDKFQRLTEDIRAGAQKASANVTMDEKTKNDLIQQGRDEIRASLKKV
jgi:hypothetical protein